MTWRRFVFIAVSAAVGFYYLWAVRATGHSFEWGRDLGGYYDYLGRAFARGHLYLPVEPARELLAMANPYDPDTGNDFKLWDAALYRGRYYLYHGSGPAVLLFAPWRIVAGHDLPENFALFLFCFGGYLLAAATLMRILSMMKIHAPPAMLALFFMALGVCQCVPFLLSRVWVYEIAISSGYFCVSAVFFLMTRSFGSPRSAYWLAGAGLMSGLAIACRPPLFPVACAGLVLAALTAPRRREAVVAFAAPLIAVGIGIAAYNYARFGNPFEFGIRYLLSGPNQNRIRLDAANIAPGLYYDLLCRPTFEAVFPWVRTVTRYPFGPASHLPKGMFLEPTIGALFLAPFAAFAIFLPRRGNGPTMVLWCMLLSSVAILMFLAATGFVTQRYEVDFLPLTILPALVSAAALMERSSWFLKKAARFVLILSIAFGIAVSLALGITGPYDEMLKNRPAGYARIAGWFSPAKALRPMLNPRIDVELTVSFDRLKEGAREPLLTLGRGPYSQFLVAGMQGGAVRLTLRSGSSIATYDLPPSAMRPVAIAVRSTSKSGELTVTIDGNNAIAEDAGIIFTTPSQITVGENRIDPGVSAPQFGGRIDVRRKIVEPD